MRTLTSRRLVAAVLAVTVFAPCATLPAQESGQRPLVPESFTLSEAATTAIGQAWLTDEERSALRVFHGVWDEPDLDVPANEAIVALNAWRFGDPVLADPAVPVEIRAEAKRFAGELQAAIDLLADADSIRAGRILAEAYEGLGNYEAASAALGPVVRRLLAEKLVEASDLTDGVRALAVRARIEGQPARDYKTMMSLLGRAHQELDRLYWPATLTEAQLLLDKHNRREAIVALHETLELNPRCAEAWYELGAVALAGFDFDSANIAIAALKRIDREHPLWRLLYAESRLVQNDPEEALDVLDRVIADWPRLRPARELAAAATALLFDDAATRAALDTYDALSPGSAQAYATTGRFLSMFRQYDEAARVLEEAIRRQPAWPAPRIELALMEMQTGRDDRALSALREVVEIDPFNKRVANSLHLLEELAEYQELETEHFTIRYQAGEDEVLAELMPETLDRIHDTVASRFGWTLPRKTIIELMPDHKKFAVRITGMPHIHTIAACTGPIIALEVPRDGPATLHRGPFDWARVIQHEYTHTVTLDQTRYRIPHWLTEAAAVSMEHAPREYDECVMLADSFRAGTLFDLDEIKWAFVRPRRPGDRGKAYAQGHWMVEFMNERFGPDALVALLERYFEGDREEDAMPTALGVSRERFFADFLVWAGAEVKAWGLAPEPSLVELTDELRWADPELALVMVASQQARLDAVAEALARRIGSPAPPNDRPLTADQWPELMRPPVEIDDEQLRAWRREYPDHPDLLREELHRRMEGKDVPGESLIPKLERLAELRPVDLFPHRKLAQIYLASDNPEKAIPHLEELDRREQYTPVYARQLATLYRRTGDLAKAREKITRAVFIDPYHAGTRELAAAIAVQAGDLTTARLHVRALTILEPDRPQHEKRLKRLEELM